MKPNICLIRIDETEHCAKDWLEEWAINKVWAWYLFDADLHVHLCSLSPSYELHFYGYTTENNIAEDDERSRDGLDMELSDIHFNSEAISYHAARAIDALSEENKAILGTTDDGEELGDDQDENDRIREAALQGAREQIHESCPETILENPDYVDFFTREDPPPTGES